MILVDPLWDVLEDEVDCEIYLERKFEVKGKLE